MANYLNFTKAIFNPYNPKVLNEGQFSWMTYDTDKQIGSESQNTIDVYMYDDKGNQWYEKGYEGYGEFGNMDYYELLATMNGFTEEDLEDKALLKAIRAVGKPEMRDIGIALAFDPKGKKIKTRAKGNKVLFPALVEDPRFNWKRHDFTQEAESDPNQSWYQEPEYDDYEDDDDYEQGWYESLKANEGAMSEIHIMAKEAKNAEDFKKEFYKEYGTKVKKSSETDKWIKELYTDATNESEVTEKPELTWDSLKESLGLNEAKKLGIGDRGVDYNDNVVEIIAIGRYDKIAKMFKKEMKTDAEDYGFEELAANTDYYLTKNIEATEGNVGDFSIYPVRYDMANYWGLDEVDESKVNEGRSITKISKDHATTVLDMSKTVGEWKEAEGDRKTELLELLRALNKRKAELEAELDTAVAGKDRNIQLALDEAEELAYLEIDIKNILEVNEQEK